MNSNNIFQNARIFKFFCDKIEINEPAKTNAAIDARTHTW